MSPGTRPSRGSTSGSATRSPADRSWRCACLEQAGRYFADSESDAFSIGIVHMNLAEAELDIGRVAAARRHMTIAVGQLTAAGHYPCFMSRCAVILSEASVLDRDLPRAFGEAHDAHRHAVEAATVMEQAAALAALAVACPDGEAKIVALVRAARTLTSGLSPQAQVLGRMAVDRQLAVAGLRGGMPGAAGDLAALRVAAGTLGLDGLIARLSPMLAALGIQI